MRSISLVVLIGLSFSGLAACRNRSGVESQALAEGDGTTGAANSGLGDFQPLYDKLMVAPAGSRNKVSTSVEMFQKTGFSFVNVQESEGVNADLKGFHNFGCGMNAGDSPEPRPTTRTAVVTFEKPYPWKEGENPALKKFLEQPRLHIIYCVQDQPQGLRISDVWIEQRDYIDPSGTP